MNKKSMTQAEKINTALELLQSVWDEFCSDFIDEDGCENAVFCQVYVNRIVWKLNSLNNPSMGDPV